MLQLANSRLHNPLVQFVHKITNPILKPLHKIIPIRINFDLAALLVALVLQIIQLYLILLLSGMYIPASAIGGLCVWGVGELLDLLIVFLMFAVIIQVVASWLIPGQYNPGTAAFINITEPLFTRVRRILPDFGMIDFSPMVVIFLLFLSRMLITTPIIILGKNLM